MICWQYACNDGAVPRDQLYQQAVGVHGRTLSALVRQVRLRRAAEQKLRMVQTELHHAQQQLAAVKEQLEVERASASFIKDGNCLFSCGLAIVHVMTVVCMYIYIFVVECIIKELTS